MVVPPGITKNVTINLLKYSQGDCKFNVLPAPQILTYFDACHKVSPGDGGGKLVDLHCHISNGIEDDDDAATHKGREGGHGH